MKSNKILITFLTLPLLLGTTSALASNKVSSDTWTVTGKNKAKVLAQNVKNSEGLVLTCTNKKIVLQVNDLETKKGDTVSYWTESSKGEIVAKADGKLNSNQNDDDTFTKFMTHIIHDNTLKFKSGKQTITYTLTGSANAIKSLENCNIYG